MQQFNNSKSNLMQNLIRRECSRGLLFLRKHWLVSLFVIVGGSYLFWRWADSNYGTTPCPPGVIRHAPHAITHETCPVAAQINGVKLAIPQHYLLGPKGYKGIDIWNAESYKKRPRTDSFDNELDNFAIKIRLSNFKPIVTFKDQVDYSSLGSLIGVPPPENRWIHVGIKTINSPYDFERTVQLWLRDKAKRGPFVLRPDSWKLKHYVSIQVPTVDDKTWAQTKQMEFFYDPNHWTTFISCQNAVVPTTHRQVKQCQLQFFLPTIQAIVNVDTLYDATDLARWHEIEREVREVIQSFIVP